jgi:hypothetical protein
MVYSFDADDAARLRCAHDGANVLNMPIQPKGVNAENRSIPASSNRPKRLNVAIVSFHYGDGKWPKGKDEDRFQNERPQSQFKDAQQNALNE